MNTKEKIIQESRVYFNQEGYAASSLYQVSQTMGISRGNLTYHFKDKEALLDIHLNELQVLYDQAISNSVLVPSWKSLYEATTRFHKLQRDYSFIFFDKAVLFIPKVKALMRKLREKNITTQMSMINISIQMGNMKSESVSGVYHNISRTYWIISYFWAIAEYFEGEDDVAWDKLLWSMFLPHFTPKGIQSFKEHFGQEYYETLGVSYVDYVQKLVNF